MATTFTLTTHLFACAIWNVTQQLLDSAFAPIGHGAGHRFNFGQQCFTDRFPPIAGLANFWDRAHVAASRAVTGSARFLFGVDVEASFLAIALAASGSETTVAAFLRNLQTGRGRQQVFRDIAFNVELTMFFEAFGDVGERVPQALAPIVEFSEWFALGFLLFNAGSAIFVRSVRVATTLALAVFLNAVSIGQSLAEFAVSFAAPVG